MGQLLVGGMWCCYGVGSLGEGIGDTAGGMEHYGDPEMNCEEAGLAQPACIGGAEFL